MHCFELFLNKYEKKLEVFSPNKQNVTTIIVTSTAECLVEHTVARGLLYELDSGNYVTNYFTTSSPSPPSPIVLQANNNNNVVRTQKG